VSAARGWSSVDIFRRPPFQVIGTNHVLPTRQAARFSGGLCVQKFLRITTVRGVLSLALFYPGPRSHDEPRRALFSTKRSPIPRNREN
jgi:hypothetical protein